MRCRIEEECSRLENELKEMEKNRDQWRTWHHDQRTKHLEWVENWFDKLESIGIAGNTLEEKMINLEREYLSLKLGNV